MKKNLFLLLLLFTAGLTSCSKKSSDNSDQSYLRGLLKTERVTTDSYSQVTTLEYNSNRQLVKMTSGSVVLEYHYINSGLIIGPYGDSLLLNGSGRLEKTVSSNGKKITFYEYDSNGFCIKRRGKDTTLPDSCMTESTSIYLNGNLMSTQTVVPCDGIIYNATYTYTDTLNISNAEGSGQPYLEASRNLVREGVQTGIPGYVIHFRYTYELYPDGYVKKKVTDYNGKITIREYTYYE